MTKHRKEEKQARKRAQLLLIVAGAVALAFVFAALLPTLKDSINLKISATPQENRPAIGRHPLSGMPVYEAVGLPQVYGVMIDNHVDAWPQAGLDHAFLVVEAPVEAGISRMLAFFSADQEAKKIGPVRSARPYFIEWNNELDALYAHVGGSDAALDRIASGGTYDLNQYWFGSSFWRSMDRYAPHNVYTSTELLSAYVKSRAEKGAPLSPLYESWLFKDPAVSPQPSVERIALTFFAPTYIAEWKYDQVTNRYLRFQGGSAHVMEDGTPVIADNVAVVITDVQILDTVGRRKIVTRGEGKAFVFQDGGKIEGTWKKTSESQRLRFYDATGSEVVFNSGVTWIEVISRLADLEAR